MNDNNTNIPVLPREDSLPGESAIKNLIYVIRDRQVMLDSDLARLYGVETKALNQAVKRNAERFPEDFMFQLTKEECLRSQIVTLNEGRGKHLKYYPHVFTENGVAMLSGILRSKVAIEVNIRIMRTFTAMRGFLQSNAQIFKRLETLEHNQLLIYQHLNDTDRRFEELMMSLDSKNAEPIEGFFYDGQIFDAYSLVSDLIRRAEKRVVLIDNYVDDRILKMMDKRKNGVIAIIYTNPRNSHIQQDLTRHNAQYPVIEVKECRNVHDRFLIIDNVVYFIGGSIKDLGKKIVAFSQMKQNPEDILSRL